MPEVVVLDACALIALFNDEPSAAVVEAALSNAGTAGKRLPICAVNWCEVVYAAARRLERAPREVVGVLTELPIEFVAADQGLALRAAGLKADHALGLGDAFAASLALELGIPLMTSDPDFVPLEKHGLELILLA